MYFTGQRILTYRAAYLIVAYFNWDIFISALVLSTILIPRILFSLFVIRHQRDLSHRQPRDPNHKVNLSIRLLHYVYKGSRRFYRVLSGIENEIFFIKNQIQYVAIQLLGHSYNVQSINVFGDLESIIFIGWSIFTCTELRTDVMYLLSLVLVISLRVGILFRSWMLLKKTLGINKILMYILVKFVLYDLWKFLLKMFIYTEVS